MHIYIYTSIPAYIYIYTYIHTYIQTWLQRMGSTCHGNRIGILIHFWISRFSELYPRQGGWTEFSNRPQFPNSQTNEVNPTMLKDYFTPTPTTVRENWGVLVVLHHIITSKNGVCTLQKSEFDRGQYDSPLIYIAYFFQTNSTGASF